MRKILIIIAVLLTQTTSLFSQGLELQSVINVLQKALFRASSELSKQNNLPPLDRVEISLEVESIISGSGGVELWVISTSGEIKKTNSQKITIVLKPDRTKHIQIGSDKLDSELVKNLIIQASLGVAKSSDGDIPLLVDNVEIEMALSIEKSGDAKIGFDIGVVKLGAGGTMSKMNAHTVKVVFQR